MLYGGDPKYVTELADLVDSVLDELLGAVNAYSDPNLVCVVVWLYMQAYQYAYTCTCA